MLLLCSGTFRRGKTAARLPSRDSKLKMVTYHYNLDHGFVQEKRMRTICPQLFDFPHLLSYLTNYCFKSWKIYLHSTCDKFHVTGKPCK
jgi:hypothetical protein